MQFLKIMFWCLLAFVAALFTYGNWTPVTIQLWSGMEALVKLPFLLLVAFLAGLLPTLAWNHAVRWRLRQRLAAAEREVAQARYAATVEPVVLQPDPLPADPAPDPILPTMPDTVARASVAPPAAPDLAKPATVASEPVILQPATPVTPPPAP